MKKGLTVISVFIAMLSSVNAQTDSAKLGGVILKVDMFWPISGLLNHYYMYSASAEVFVSLRMSMQLTGFYGGAVYGQFDYTTHNERTYIIGPEVKYFTGKSKQHSGLYVGAFALYDHMVDAVDNTLLPSDVAHINRNYNTYYGGVMAGIQYYAFKRLEVDCLIGIGAGTEYEYELGSSIMFNGVYPTSLANVNVGYRF